MYGFKHESLLLVRAHVRRLIVLGLMLCSVSHAFAHHEVGELNPDELGYRFAIDSCIAPISPFTAELVQTLEGVFIRSRLNPVEYKHDGPQVILNVYIRCRGVSYYGKVSLIRNYFDVEVFGHSVAHVDYYGEDFLASSFKYFISEFKAVVENVVTVYIKEAEGF